MLIPTTDDELIEAMAQRVETWSDSGSVWVRGGTPDYFGVGELIRDEDVNYVWENGGPAVMLAVAKHICPEAALDVLVSQEEIGGSFRWDDNPDYVVKLGNSEYRSLLADQFRRILPEYLPNVDDWLE